MQFSKSFIRQVADATDLVDLISDHGVTLKRVGSSYKGLCPFHSEKTPSFNVNPERGFFHCFGCSVSGDGIKFLMQYDRLSFSEAVKELAKRTGSLWKFSPEDYRVPIRKKTADYIVSRRQRLFTVKNFLSRKEKMLSNIYSSGRFRKACGNNFKSACLRTNGRVL